jgi:hypothetical protein
VTARTTGGARTGTAGGAQTGTDGVRAGTAGVWAGRVGLAVAAGLAAALALGGPASAHGADAPDGTDYRTAVTSLTPAVAGLSVRTIESGARLELANRTGRIIEVLGYQGEPYLEVRPDGVYENQHSPATYLNRTLAGETEPPATADPTVPPSWRRIATEPVVRWHDQRTHWLEDDRPPQVRAEPGRQHRVRDWTVPLRDSMSPLEIRGTLDWLPPPDPFGWWAVIALGTLLVAALGLLPANPAGPAAPSPRLTTPAGPAAPSARVTTPAGPAAPPARAANPAGPAPPSARAATLARAVTATLAVLCAAGGLGALAFAVGRQADAGAGGIVAVLRGMLTGQVWAVLAALGALAAGAYVLARRPAGDFALALAGACLALFAGVTNAALFSRSIAPVPGPAGWARVVIALVIVAGAGVAGAAVLRLRATGRAGEGDRQPGGRGPDDRRPGGQGRTGWAVAGPVRARHPR